VNEIQHNDEPVVDEAMEAAKAETERPSWLPEKFKSPEDLAKSYTELESKMRTPEQEAETPELAVIMQQAREMYDSDGQIDEKTLEKLEAAGLNKETVNTFIEGVQALSAREMGEIYNAAGGEDQYKSAVEWASENFSDEEIDAFNEIVDSGNKKQIQWAVKSLAAQYKTANAKPVEVSGQTARATSDVFKSVAELKVAMSDPRYKPGPQQDPSYIQEVEKKLARSSILGAKS
jgi:hypothetical protein